VLLCSITVFRNWSVSCLCHGKERSSGFFCVEIFVTLMNLSPIFHGGALMTWWCGKENPKKKRIRICWIERVIYLLKAHEYF
jgi:hypothetical protein